MILLIKVKDTDNVIGLKEDIAMRLEGVADIEMIDVRGQSRCKDCPAFSTTVYQCHNERGIVAHCAFGYMDRYDMRDFSGDKKFKFCGFSGTEKGNNNG